MENAKNEAGIRTKRRGNPVWEKIPVDEKVPWNNKKKGTYSTLTSKRKVLQQG